MKPMIDLVSHDLADVTQAAFQELRCLRGAEARFQKRISQAMRVARRSDPSISALVVQIAHLTLRVEQLEARQRRRDEAGARLWGKPVDEGA